MSNKIQQPEMDLKKDKHKKKVVKLILKIYTHFLQSQFIEISNKHEQLRVHFQCL